MGGEWREGEEVGGRVGDSGEIELGGMAFFFNLCIFFLVG